MDNLKDYKVDKIVPLDYGKQPEDVKMINGEIYKDGDEWDDEIKYRIRVGKEELNTKIEWAANKKIIDGLDKIVRLLTSIKYNTDKLRH